MVKSATWRQDENNARHVEILLPLAEGFDCSILLERGFINEIVRLQVPRVEIHFEYPKAKRELFHLDFNGLRAVSVRTRSGLTRPTKNKKAKTGDTAPEDVTGIRERTTPVGAYAVSRGPAFKDAGMWLGPSGWQVAKHQTEALCDALPLNVVLRPRDADQVPPPRPPVTLDFPGSRREAVFDDRGEARFEVPKGLKQAVIRVSAEGFEPLERTIDPSLSPCDLELTPRQSDRPSKKTVRLPAALALAALLLTGVAFIALFHQPSSPVAEAEQAALIVEPKRGVTSENGEAATFTVKLASKPEADVQLGIQSSNPNEGQPQQYSFLFDPDNWNQSQTLQVRGVDDGKNDGAQSYRIHVQVDNSADERYRRLAKQVLELTNHDNERAQPQPPAPTQTRPDRRRPYGNVRFEPGSSNFGPIQAEGQGYRLTIKVSGVGNDFTYQYAAFDQQLELVNVESRYLIRAFEKSSSGGDKRFTLSLTIPPGCGLEPGGYSGRLKFIEQKNNRQHELPFQFQYQP